MNNYSDVLFDFKENDQITLTLAYRLVKPIPSPLIKVVFPFVITDVKSTVKDQLETTVNAWFTNFQLLVLRPTILLLGRNIQLVYIQLENTNSSQVYKLPLSNKFGLCDSNSDFSTALHFELLTLSKSSSQRFYLRAPANLFCKFPLNPDLEAQINEVEKLFVKPLRLFDDVVGIVYQRRDGLHRRILSATLKSVVKVRPSVKNELKKEVKTKKIADKSRKKPRLAKLV
jgi:hypothetical protein